MWYSANTPLTKYTTRSTSVFELKSYHLPSAVGHDVDQAADCLASIESQPQRVTLVSIWCQ
jgi:hypothetical protein